MLTPGEPFGSYRIIREIGRGAMGAVFEAEHIQLRKRVAIKVLLPAAARDEAAVQRFLREGEAAARIRHEHIVDVSDVGTRDDVPYLVMEYLDGETLADRLSRKRRFDDTELADLVIPVCDALALAHESGVVHRDIKPDNIFVARTHRGGLRAILVDFGISHVAHNDPKLARLTSSSVLIGTPCYLSPEAARSARNVDARSDQYAFGVTLYECRTGLLPYERASIFEMLSAILLEDPVPPSNRTPGIDSRMEVAILRAMSRSPDDRFPDMRALALALLPMASPTVRAQWEPELLAHSRPAARSTPIGELDAEHRHPISTADDLRPLPSSDHASLASTNPDALLAAVSDETSTDPMLPVPPTEDTPADRPREVSRRRWFVGAALALSAALAAAVIARSPHRSPAPSVVVAAAPRPTPIVAPAPVEPVAIAVQEPPLPVAPHVDRPRRVVSHVVRRPTLAPVAPAVVAHTPPAPAPRSLLRTDFGTTTP